MELGKYSMGVGDRFGHQAEAQLEAILRAKAESIEVEPVWNKSFREHSTIGTAPADVRKQADEAVRAKGWKGAYFVDADHINNFNVDGFIEYSDFFTLDVADFTGKSADKEDINDFVDKHSKLAGVFAIDGIEQEFDITIEQIREMAQKYLRVAKEAGKIYRHIEKAKGKDNFITEVSIDETDHPQTPIEMLFILAAIADENIPAQTIAPKFTGRFNKGVDYVGDVERFEKEFNDDLAVIRFAINEFGLPANLKLSVHSGSDKFSIYESINKMIKKFNAGLHLKTSGTTWLEELVGLAFAGGAGLEIAKVVYARAFDRFDELCGPYATVIDIDKDRLPLPDEVAAWSNGKFANVLRHDQSCDQYDLNVRQLLHVGYKIAAELGDQFISVLEENKAVVAECVTENILRRHIIPVFKK